MHKFTLIAGTVLAMCFPAFGQEARPVEVLGAYSYLNVDTNGVSSRQSASGWETSVSANFNKWLAAESDFGAYFKAYPVDLTALGLGTINVNVHDFGLVGGPRFNFRPAFFHVLVGVDHLTGSALGYSASQDSFAAALGGGIQQKVTGHWAMRLSADYVLTQHNIFGALGSTYRQNNFRASVGFVYSFGGTREYNSRTQNRTASASSQTETISEAASLGVTGYATESGFKITSVRPRSPAAQNFLNPGDIISSIDDRDVHTGSDIESVIAASGSGTIKISYLAQTAAMGMFVSVREVKVR